MAKLPDYFLSDNTYLILLLLSQADAAISFSRIKRKLEEPDWMDTLNRSSFYNTVKIAREKGLIELTDELSPTDSSRSEYWYRITPEGLRRLEARKKRLQDLVSLIQDPEF